MSPSRRLEAIERLYAEGFDVQLRLSPYIPQFIAKGYLDLDKINSVKCDKILVEFLRVNTWISRWFDIDYSEYTAKAGGYNHMPIQKKLKYLKKITGFKELSVCEDLPFTFHYWERNINHNPKDCCNLRINNDK